MIIVLLIVDFLFAHKLTQFFSSLKLLIFPMYRCLPSSEECLINASRFFFFLRDTQAFFSYFLTQPSRSTANYQLNGWNWKMMERIFKKIFFILLRRCGVCKRNWELTGMEKQHTFPIHFFHIHSCPQSFLLEKKRYEILSVVYYFVYTTRWPCVC